MPHRSPTPPTRTSRSRVRPARGRVARSAVLVALAAGLVAAAAPPPVPLGIGDRLFPYLGNPGYDVLTYDISLTYPGRNDRPLAGVTRIQAVTTEDLERLNLDFTHGTVSSVTVDGRRADFASVDEDLVVTPAEPLRHGQVVDIAVTHTSDPRGPADSGGWVQTSDGLAMANQADAAHRVFPCNDHPSDKAFFTFRITAPDDLTVVANGLAEGREQHGDRTTWTYRTAHPMATELAQVSIGDSAVLRREGPHGLPVRDVVRTVDQEVLEPWLSDTPGHLEWMERKVGRYPFEDYGLVVADADTGFELETQTLSLFERRLFTDPAFPAWYVESVMVHELSHQWFGDSVSPHMWSDLWLNEGHATWYESLYAEEHGGPTLEARMKASYAKSDQWRADDGPPAEPKPPEPGKKISIFRPVVYNGAALALYALRTEIGADAFDRLERRWVAEHRDGNASTADFVALASEVAGRDLGDFLDAWLYGTKTPPMPGHPDWRSKAPERAGTRTPERAPAPASKQAPADRAKAEQAPAGGAERAARSVSPEADGGAGARVGAGPGERALAGAVRPEHPGKPG
ncbi:M1 family metallopeptidase [Streptomyces sp. NPDC046203]|uniref:M1 family metallopeptidase n=1 Tax=Streptomyces sp. NPDC046203 TaxID=3154602 RepID=UPI0033CC48F3